MFNTQTRCQNVTYVIDKSKSAIGVVVDPEKSELLQKKAFNIGFRWTAEPRGVLYTDKEVLWFNRDKSLGYGSTHDKIFTQELRQIGTLNKVKEHILNLIVKREANMNKVAEDIQIDFNDLLDRGALRTCVSFKDFLDAFGAKKVSLAHLNEQCILKGRSGDAAWLQEKFPEAFVQKEFHKIGDEFKHKGTDITVKLIDGFNPRDHKIYALNMINSGLFGEVHTGNYSITDEELNKCLNVNNWRDHYIKMSK